LVDPDQPKLLRRGAAIDFLGINLEVFDKLVKAGRITPVRLYQGARAYYKTSELLALIGEGIVKKPKAGGKRP